MATTASKRELSASTDGSPIAVAATATPGTNIHTASANNAAANDYDEVWLYATNIDTTPRLLTIEFGGTAAGNQVMMVIPAQSTVFLMRCIIENSKTLAAFAASANKINLFGWVNRMAP